MNGFVYTDPDCSLYVRDCGKRQFECYQIQGINPDDGECAVVHDWICVDDLAEEDVLFLIEMYDYDSLLDFFKEYGEKSWQIIAECAFETHSCFNSENYLTKGTYEYCRFWLVGHLREWEERYGCLE